MSRIDYIKSRVPITGRGVCLLLAAALAFAASTQTVRSIVYGYDQDIDKLNRFVQSSGNGSDASTKVFREARDFINDQQWAKAEQSFSSFVATYPSDSNVDAALYYLAFALKKQNRLEEADRTLDRLIKEFAGSAWINDARAMRIEIAPRLKNKSAIEQGINEPVDELRLVALQSLFESNPDRALKIAGELLSPGSTASSMLKEGAITLLGDSEQQQAASILIELARKEPDARLRRAAIRALADVENETALEILNEVVTSSTDKELVQEAANSLADMNNPRAHAFLVNIARTSADRETRMIAINKLGDIDSEAVVEELVRLFDSEKDEEVRREIIDALADMNSPRAENKVIELARTAATFELREKAISAIGDRGGEKAVAALIELYDSEKSEEMKERILDALGDSNEKRALRKLMEVVRSSASINLKKKALSLLGDSDDPEAAKFLEEILKKN